MAEMTPEDLTTRKGKLEFTAELLETASRTGHAPLPSAVDAAAAFLREFVVVLDEQAQAIREAERRGAEEMRERIASLHDRDASAFDAAGLRGDAKEARELAARARALPLLGDEESEEAPPEHMRGPNGG